MNNFFEVQQAWKSQHLLDNRQWVYEVNEILEINEAIKIAKKTKKKLSEVTKKDFPLPELSKKLHHFSDSIENGVGVVLLKGIPIENYSYKERQLILWGIGLYLGKTVPQSRDGSLIMDMKYNNSVFINEEKRGVNTRETLTYHTDLADIIGMFSLNNADSGGETMIASSAAVHNEILHTRPDLLEVLYQPYCYISPPWDKNKELFNMRPVFSVNQGKFVCDYVRPFIDWAQENPSAPKLSKQQKTALDYFDEISNNEKFSFKFIMEPGSMLFFNNFTTLHSRTEFFDNDEKYRHLLRLWLSAPNSRNLDKSLEVSYRNIRAGEVRGGIFY